MWFDDVPLSRAKMYNTIENFERSVKKKDRNGQKNKKKKKHKKVNVNHKNLEFFFILTNLKVFFIEPMPLSFILL